MLVLMDILSNRAKADANANADSNKICSNDFECNICLEHVKDPVVTLCGHLYCWPCIYKWINSTSWEHNEKPECPICKSEISESTLVPLYGRGKTTSSSEGEAHQDGVVVPPRPLGPRSLDTATVSQPELEQAEAEAEAPPAQESSLHICWEETFNTFPTKLHPRTVVHNWLGPGVCPKVVAKGLRCIFSNQGVWYLDHVDVPWDVVYNAEPLEGIHEASEQKLVLGGEVCMWAERADTSDVQQTIWPRAAAAAERLWSERQYTSGRNSNSTALSRLQYFRCLLNRRGVPAAPVTNFYARTAPDGPGSCFEQ